MVRVREHTLRNASVMMIFVKEVFLGVFTCLLWDSNQVEVIEDLLLLGSPVIIVEVIIDPHKSLVNHFRHNRFADGCTGNGELHLLTSAHP